MDPDSKYNIGANTSNGTKFQMKLKPSPLLFNRNGNGNSAKKIKLSEDGASKPVNVNNKLNINGNKPNFNIANHKPNMNGAKPNFNISKQNMNGNSKPKLSIHDQKRRLPIFGVKSELLNHIKKNDTLIVLGETGSGKTTQIPQYIYSAKLNNDGVIGITQPRRVAAISIATRVAQELGGNGLAVGETVGYTVRFEDVTSKKTKIKYLTDGMLLREAIFDRYLRNYTVIILDEAHERTVQTDVLFGIVKRAQKVRAERNMTPLKIIIMSATMDVDHFSEYFDNCQVVYLEGRTFPVEIFYSRIPHEDYQTACIATFFKIHREAPANHDVLIFLTGQEEIEAAAHQIRLISRDPEVVGPPIKVFTLYAAQASTQQMAVFQPIPQNMRKVIISTNIAETSVTISGIKYVIDCGMVKVRTYHASTGLDMLKVQRISQEQAWQRAGRAGRESKGYCYRVYTRSQFESMQKSTVPETQRANLNSICLQLLAMEIHAKYFDFLDKPSKESLDSAFEQLRLLGAVENIYSTTLTPLGKRMAKFPLDPRFSKILLAAGQHRCVDEALTIVALMSVETLFCNSISKRKEAEEARQKFSTGFGDHISYLNIYKEFNKVGQDNKRSWCSEHFISMRNILLAREIRSQLEELCKSYDIPVSSCGDQTDRIRKCLLHGLFMNIAELEGNKTYVTLDKRQSVLIHPTSYLYGQQPHFVIFTEVVQTSRCYIRGLTTIECDWIQEIASEYIKSHNIRYNHTPWKY